MTNDMQTPAPVIVKKGGVTGPLALLIALGAAGGAGYLWHQGELYREARKAAEQQRNFGAEVNQRRLTVAIQAVAQQQEIDLQDLKSRADRQDERIVALQGDLADRRAAIEALQTLTNQQRGEIGALGGNLQTLSEAVNAQLGTIETVQSNIRAAQTDVRIVRDDLQGTKTLIQTDLQSLRDLIQGLRVDFAGSQGDLNTLRDRLNTVQTELASLNEQLSSQNLDLQARIGSVSESLSVQQGEIEIIKGEIRGLQTNASSLLTQLEHLNEREIETTTALRNDLGSFQNRVENFQLNLGSVLNTLEAVKVVAARGGDVNGFALAEVEYLLRLADHKLRHQQAVSTAIEALEIARERVKRVDENIFLVIERRLGDDIATLRNLQLPNYPALASKIRSLSRQISELPLQTDTRLADLKARFDPLQTASGAQTASDSWVDQIIGGAWRNLSEVIVVREIEMNDRRPPLTSPEAQFFLFENISLQLEAMRLALLSRDTESYQAAATQAIEWLTRYFDRDNPQFSGVVSDLTTLKAVQINPFIPDISPTLRAFEEIMTRREPIRSASIPALSEGR